MSDRDELERLKAELGAARKQLAGMAAPRIEAEAASWRRRLAELERRERGTFGRMNGDSQQALAALAAIVRLGWAAVDGRGCQRGL